MAKEQGVICKIATSPHDASPFDKMSSTIGLPTEFCPRTICTLLELELGCTNDNQCKTRTDLNQFKSNLNRFGIDLINLQKKKRRSHTGLDLEQTGPLAR